MRRPLWIGAAAAVLIAVTAIPLWRALDDGGGDERRAAAFVAETDCSRAKDELACLELNRQLVELDTELEALDQRTDDFQEEIEKWEEKLAATGDDAQLANVDLQNVLQKQQQTLQMMSNISKMLYDTRQSVIRRIGG
ncbi:MAG: hypothetical protein ACXWZY_07440 [Gaiellaceae bacterium]